MWYLSEELTPMALADAELTATEKQAIADRILDTLHPQQFQPTKPEMKTALLERPPHQIKLADFIGPRSMLLFHTLDNDSEWLTLPVAEWAGNPDYSSFCESVRYIKVVNDCAERSIKDVTEYVNYARDRDQRNQAIIVVQHHRQLYDCAHLIKAQLDALENDEYL